MKRLINMRLIYCSIFICVFGCTPLKESHKPEPNDGIDKVAEINKDVTRSIVALLDTGFGDAKVSRKKMNDLASSLEDAGLILKMEEEVADDVVIAFFADPPVFFSYRGLPMTCLGQNGDALHKRLSSLQKPKIVDVEKMSVVNIELQKEVITCYRFDLIGGHYIAYGLGDKGGIFYFITDVLPGDRYGLRRTSLEESVVNAVRKIKQ